MIDIVDLSTLKLVKYHLKEMINIVKHENKSMNNLGALIYVFSSGKFEFCEEVPTLSKLLDLVTVVHISCRTDVRYSIKMEVHYQVKKEVPIKVQEEIHTTIRPKVFTGEKPTLSHDMKQA